MELLLPVVFFGIVAVILPAVIFAGLIVFTVRDALEERRQSHRLEHPCHH